MKEGNDIFSKNFDNLSQADKDVFREYLILRNNTNLGKRVIEQIRIEKPEPTSEGQEDQITLTPRFNR